MPPETFLRPHEVFRDVLLIDRPTFSDERGFFREYLRLGELEKALGAPIHFVQVNHSRSKNGVLRGVHVASYQKLMYVLRGEALIAIIDLRPESATFGAHAMITLGDSRRTSIFLPPGFGNAVYVLSDELEYCFHVTEYYDPTKEKNIRWDDPDLAIPWPNAHPVLSARDTEKSQALRDIYPEHFLGRT